MKKLMIGLLAASLVLGTTACKSEKERRIKKYGALERSKTSEEKEAEAMYEVAAREDGSYDPTFKLVYPIDTNGYNCQTIRYILQRRYNYLKSMIDSPEYFLASRTDSAKLFIGRYKDRLDNMPQDSLNIKVYYDGPMAIMFMPTDNIDDSYWKNLQICVTPKKEYICPLHTKKYEENIFFREKYYPYLGEKQNIYRDWDYKL